MFSTHYTCPRHASAPAKGAKLRTILLAGVLLACAAPSFATPTGCAAGYSDPSVLLDVAFATVARDAMPGTVSTNASIVVKCASSSGSQELLRWTLTPRSLTFTMLQGTTPSSVVSAVGSKFSLATNVLEVNDAVPGYTPKYQAEAGTTATLSGLSSKLSAGQYRLRQLVDVSQETCRVTGNHLSCRSDGVLGQYSANYVLNVVETLTTPTTPPSTGTGPTTPPSTGTGTGTTTPTKVRRVTPNPWTVKGYAAKRQCGVCDALRAGD